MYVILFGGGVYAVRFSADGSSRRAFVCGKGRFLGKGYPYGLFSRIFYACFSYHNSKDLQLARRQGAALGIGDRKKEKVQNTVKLDTNNVKEKNKEQEKQKKKGFC